MYAYRLLGNTLSGKTNTTGHKYGVCESTAIAGVLPDIIFSQEITESFRNSTEAAQEI